MNKITNILLVLSSIPILGLCVFIGLDLPLELLKTTGAQLPYQDILFGACFGWLFFIVFRRSMKRWTGMRLVNQLEKFVWNQPISKNRKQRVITYNLLETLVFTSLAIGTYLLCPQGWLISLGYGIGCIDNLVFTVLGSSKNLWRIGITKKAVLLADRDVRVAYFYGLRKISFAQETLFFDYIKDLHLHLPLTAVEDQKSFFAHLANCIDEEKVYWDESTKTLR